MATEEKKNLRNIGRCLDNIEKDNEEEIKKEGSSDCSKCNDCTCGDKKEDPKYDVVHSKEYFDMLTDFGKIIDFDKMLNKEYEESVGNK